VAAIPRMIVSKCSILAPPPSSILHRPLCAHSSPSPQLTPEHT
jgi:hypothetical protein